MPLMEAVCSRISEMILCHSLFFCCPAGLSKSRQSANTGCSVREATDFSRPPGAVRRATRKREGREAGQPRPQRSSWVYRVYSGKAGTLQTWHEHIPSLSKSYKLCLGHKPTWKQDMLLPHLSSLPSCVLFQVGMVLFPIGAKGSEM